MPRARKPAPPALPEAAAPLVVVIETQSPISNLWLHDAKKCFDAAEWLEGRAREVATDKAANLTPIVNAMRLAADLRKQSAESLATAQERWKAEKTSTVKSGLSILPPQTSRLLANAQKAVAKLAEAQAGPDAEPREAEVA